MEQPGVDLGQAPPVAGYRQTEHSSLPQAADPGAKVAATKLWNRQTGGDIKMDGIGGPPPASTRDRAQNAHALKPSLPKKG
ncbi:MAG: hypothetical protein Udaeo2_29490 [Candidatus Udaeobacter sp.]|nr:MAG: hypothetical protein Udaeo2_29490 [Candidatus Udaeobacter sp.]